MCRDENFSKAKDFFLQLDKANGYNYLMKALGECNTRAERRELLGLSSSPSRPGGLAGIADELAQNRMDRRLVEFLLDFIEQQEGGGVALSEVWFELAKWALEDSSFESAIYYYRKARDTQGTTERIDRSAWKYPCLEIAKEHINNFSDPNRYDKAISVLSFLMISIENRDVKERVDRLINKMKTLSTLENKDDGYLIYELDQISFLSI